MSDAIVPTAPLPARLLTAARQRIRTARLPRLPGGDGEEGNDAPRSTVPLGIAAGVLAAALLGAKLFLPQGVPSGVIVLGLVIGGLNALPALAIVLVYRANRVVNFSQGELGAFAASLAYLLITSLHWSWYLAVPVCLLAAAAMGGAAEFGIMRRFFAAPRLLATVATIGLTQLLFGFRLLLPALFPEEQGFAGTFPSKLSGKASFTLSGAAFNGDHLLIIVTVPLLTIAVASYLRGSWAGLGTRAAAGNLDRSRLLGIPVRRLSTIVWIVAGLLSGVTALLRAPVAGFSLIGASGTTLMTRFLVPAAIGGFTSLPVTFAAALVLGVMEQVFFWNFARGGPIETIQLVVLLAALLYQGRKLRAFDQGDRSMSWVAVREMARVPKRLMRRPEVRTASLWLGFVAFQLLLLAPQVLAPGRLNLVGLICIHAMVGLSLVVLTGWGGQISLGHWAIVGIGAFVAGNLAVRYEMDFFITLVLGALAGGLASLLLGIPAQRMPGIMFGVTTLVFAAATQNWFFQLDWVTRGERPERPELFGAISLQSSESFYYFTIAITALVIVAVVNLKRFGLADVLVSARDNPKAAEAFGVSVTTARRMAFFLSGCIAGIAGVVYAFQQQVVAANRFPSEIGLSVLAMVVIGGLGSIPGVLCGAVIIRGAQYLLPSWASMFTTGIGLLIVLLVFPGGLGEVVFRLRDRLLARFTGEAGVARDRRDAQGEAIPAAAPAAAPVSV